MALPTGNLSRTDGGKLFLFVEIGSKIFPANPHKTWGAPNTPMLHTKFGLRGPNLMWEWAQTTSIEHLFAIFWASQEEIVGGGPS